LRIGHFDGVANTSAFKGGGNGNSGPLVFLDSMVWAFDLNGVPNNRALFVVSTRCDPQESDYYCGAYGASKNAYLPGDPKYHESYGDGQWHKIGMRLVMNSAPGVGDGKAMLWLDDDLIHTQDDVPFMGENSPGNVGWNMVMVGGNTHNYPEDESELLEQWYSIDDVKIYVLE